ncbi:MAG TPA: GNAT family N-acetyltransferase, partial [Candidatus Dojkabacteria bacterium]
KKELQNQVLEFIKKIYSELPEYTSELIPELDFDIIDIEKNYKKADGEFFIMTDDKNIIGTVGILKNNDNFIIKRLFLSKDFRGKGLGKKLINKAISFCKDSGSLNIYIDTGNEKIRNYYLKNGFEQVSNTGNLYNLKYKLQPKAIAFGGNT